MANCYSVYVILTQPQMHLYLISGMHNKLVIDFSTDQFTYSFIHIFFSVVAAAAQLQKAKIEHAKCIE